MNTTSFMPIRDHLARKEYEEKVDTIRELKCYKRSIYDNNQFSVIRGSHGKYSISKSKNQNVNSHSPDMKRNNSS